MFQPPVVTATSQEDQKTRREKGRGTTTAPSASSGWFREDFQETKRGGRELGTI